MGDIIHAGSTNILVYIPLKTCTNNNITYHYKSKQITGTKVLYHLLLCRIISGQVKVL